MFHFKCQSLVVPLRLTDKLVEAFLAASPVMTVDTAWYILQTATALLNNTSPFCQNAEVAHRRSAFFRLSGDISSSEMSIAKFWRRNWAQPDCARTNAAFGWLHISHLENLVQSQDAKSATDQRFGLSWQERTIEKSSRITPARSLMMARLIRCQGQSHRALGTLQQCLPQARDCHHQAICAMPNALIDLESSEETCTIVERELEKLNARRQQTLRRLTAYWIDAKVELEQHGVAAKMLRAFYRCSMR